METDMSTIESLSSILYQLDPMDTGCEANECRDEYDRVALGIFERIDSGQALRRSILDEFTDWFKIELESEKIDIIVDTLLTPTRNRDVIQNKDLP